MEYGRHSAGGRRRSSAASASLRPSSNVCFTMVVSITSAKLISIAACVARNRVLSRSELTRMITKLFSSATLVLVFLGAITSAQSASYDFLITNAHIVDGTGAPWFSGDIGISGDRIVAMGDLHGASAKQRIDANGLVASPGFIDVQGQSEFNLLVDGRAASKITQGVTTEITGEGTSIAPVNDRMLEDLRGEAKKYGVTLDWRSLDEYFSHLDRVHPAINLGTFDGAGGLRTYVIGKDNRPATAAELDQMRQLVAQAMQQGAFGLSSAL